jgi:hypothetical protein
MDELTMIRRLLDEPPPSPEVVDEGRRRLLGAERAAARRRLTLRRGLAFGLTAATAAVGLVLAALVSGSGNPAPGGGGPVATDLSARAVLLAAAVRAESAPTSGGYWHVRSVTRTTLPRRFGHGQNRYRLERTSVTETWTNHAGRTWLGRREWVRPATQADVAAWRRDGAPSSWCSGSTDTDPPQPICLRTAPGIASVTRFGQGRFAVTEQQRLSFGQLQRLPHDPAALRAWLVGVARHDLDPSAGDAIIDMNVEQELFGLLVDLPVRPTVRAAAFRALAGMPHVSAIGPTHDRLGRAGIGIRIALGGNAVLVYGDGGAGSAREGKLTRTLIIDPRTSQVLADGTAIDGRAATAVDTLILDAGWADGKPHRPAPATG